jgi:hypothetical protein
LAVIFWTRTTSCAAATVPNDGYLTYAGTAEARHANDFLYGERHFLRFAGGQVAERVVLYTCRDGSAFARKTVSYGDRTAPDFLVENANDGMREGIREAGRDAVPANGVAAQASGGGSAGRTVFFRAHATDPERSGPVPSVTGLVADAGFDEFVQLHWEDLMSGRPLEMRFLLPSRLTDYGFQVQRLRSETVRGAKSEVFRLRLAGFWGWFLPGIDVYYDAASHVLMRYDGLSDLRDPAGNNFKTQIDFPENERKPAGGDAMRGARAAPLAPCR